MSGALCHKYHVNAFPSVLVFRGKLETNEHYHGDRTAEAFIKFIEDIRAKDHKGVEEALGHKTNVDNVAPDRAVAQVKGSSQGCLITGFVMVKKVPGSLSIAAHSDHHSIAANVINTSHVVTHFSFGKVPPRSIRSPIMDTINH